MSDRESKATLALSTVAFPGGQFDEALEWAAHLGLAGIEIGRHHAQRLAGEPGGARRAKAAARRLGVGFTSLHAWTQVDGLDEVCPAAAELGAGLIVVHCPHERLVEAFDREVSMLAEWLGWCARRGIVLTVENSSRQPLEPFLRLFEALGDLKLTLDVKHAYKPETLGLTHADYLPPLADRLANMHVSGIDRARDPMLGDGTPPGNDHVDWRRLAADLAALRYGGLITIEWHPPADLTAAEVEAGYGRIPAVSELETTMNRRVSRYTVVYFREVLAEALRA